MLKIWGRANSINVQKVLWCCGELGLGYDRIDAGSEFGVTRTPETRIFMFDLDLHRCERRGSRRHGLLGRREDVACGRRTRYVLRTLDSKVHPSCINGLKHFFGRSGAALRDAELLERFRPPCTRDCKGFHVEIQDFTQLRRDFIRGDHRAKLDDALP